MEWRHVCPFGKAYTLVHVCLHMVMTFARARSSGTAGTSALLEVEYFGFSFMFPRNAIVLEKTSSFDAARTTDPCDAARAEEG